MIDSILDIVSTSLQVGCDKIRQALENQVENINCAHYIQQKIEDVLQISHEKKEYVENNVYSDYNSLEQIQRNISKSIILNNQNKNKIFEYKSNPKDNSFNQQSIAESVQRKSLKLNSTNKIHIKNKNTIKQPYSNDQQI